MEQKKAAILEMMTAEKEARHDERMKAINDHTTEVVNKAAEKIETKLNEKFAPLDALFGGAASGDINEQITAARNEVKLKQAWIAAKLNEKKRCSAQKKADAKAAREEKKKAKSKRKGKTHPRLRKWRRRPNPMKKRRSSRATKICPNLRRPKCQKGTRMSRIAQHCRRPANITIL